MKPTSHKAFLDKRELHRLMEAKWGLSPVGMKAQYDWLRSVTGKEHVKDLDHGQVIRAIRLFPTELGLRPVRGSVWAQLALERKNKLKESHAND